MNLKDVPNTLVMPADPVHERFGRRVAVSLLRRDDSFHLADPDRDFVSRFEPVDSQSLPDEVFEV